MLLLLSNVANLCRWNKLTKSFFPLHWLQSLKHYGRICIVFSDIQRSALIPLVRAVGLWLSSSSQLQLPPKLGPAVLVYAWPRPLGTYQNT